MNEIQIIATEQQLIDHVLNLPPPKEMTLAEMLAASCESTKFLWVKRVQTMDYILNLDGSFMSSDQIVADLLSRKFDEESANLILSGFDPMTGTDKTERMYIAFARDNFGRQIRNSYGLWNEMNPHVVQNPEPNERGIVDHPLFPDNLSGAIMDRFIEQFKTKHSGYELNDE